MQIKTERNLLNIGDAQRPVVSVAVRPRSSAGYLVAGIAIGVICGFVAGSLVTLVAGDKGLLFAQQLWNRFSGVNADGERVHFELLLQ